MNRRVMLCAALGLFAPVSVAGVVVKTEVKASDASAKSGNEAFYAEGEMVRMDSPSAAGGDDLSVIFRDQVMWFVNHEKHVCQKIDREGLAALSAQLDAVMTELAKLPPEQRAMMESMMKGKVPGMRKPAPLRVETGTAEQVGPYACTVHTGYSGDEKLWEVCSADPSVADDLAEAMVAFHAMSRFTSELQKVVQRGPFAAMIASPYNEIDELEGFPVRVRTFNDKGEIVRESTLTSIKRQDIEEAVFEIPKGYKVKDLADELKKGG